MNSLTVSPQSMMHGEVESGQVEGSPSLVTIEFLHCHEVLEVLVVCPDLELVVGTFQEVVPILQCSDDCQHLLVMDLIVSLYHTETLGVVGN